MNLLIFIFLLITPGLLALAVYNLISGKRHGFITGLIFDLLIFIINIIGLYYIKGVATVADLETVHFYRMGFTWKYATLCILVGVPLAVIAGIFSRIFKKKK